METMPPSMSSRSWTRDRLVDHRQRRRGAHRGRDRDVVPRLGAEDDPLARVEVGGRQVELALEQPEVVGAVRVGEDRAHVVLDARPRVDARSAGPRRGPRTRSITLTWPSWRREVARPPSRAAAAAATPLRANSHDVRAQQLAEVDVAERRRDLLVDDAHHLLGRDAVGDERRDERARRRADVDVELVDGLVDGQQVERAQRADLVDAAGEAAAAEDERGARRPRAAPAARRCPGGGPAARRARA